MLRTFSGVAKKLKSLFRSDTGNVTIMTGLAIVPMFIAAGVAVDTVRINREQATFQSAVDSAVLAVAADTRSAVGGLSGAALTERMKELQDLAKDYITANYSAERKNAGTVSVSVTSTNQAVQIRASNEFPTTIMKITGVNSITLEAFAEVKKAMRPIELVMVMDTTGSMNNSGKMDGAKGAARQLLSTLYGGPPASVPESEYIRVALVPFAGAVRLNRNGSDFDLNWIDTTGANPLSRRNFNTSLYNNFSVYNTLRNSSNGSVLGWNGCVEARTASGGLRSNDVAPGSSTSNPETLFPAYFAPDTPSTLSGTDNNYIGTSGTPNEYTGLTTAQRSNHALVQSNVQKYTNKSVNAADPVENCAASTLVPMTYKRANIESGINAMSPNGYTLIPEGLAWGMRAISPSQPLTKVEGSGSIPGDSIAPYRHERWQKVMVLMTDGDNDAGAGTNSLNGTSYNAWGYGLEPLANNRFGVVSSSTTTLRTAMNNATLAVCDAIKAEDVELYVTSFGSGISTSSQNLLRSCATDADHYTHASSTAALTAFFDHIGQETLNKMIYVSQ